MGGNNALEKMNDIYYLLTELELLIFQNQTRSWNPNYKDTRCAPGKPDLYMRSKRHHTISRPDEKPQSKKQLPDVRLMILRANRFSATGGPRSLPIRVACRRRLPVPRGCGIFTTVLGILKAGILEFPLSDSRTLGLHLGGWWRRLRLESSGYKRLVEFRELWYVWMGSFLKWISWGKVIVVCLHRVRTLELDISSPCPCPKLQHLSYPD